MGILKNVKLDFEVWCTDERHYDDLIKELEYLNFSENARYCVFDCLYNYWWYSRA